MHCIYILCGILLTLAGAVSSTRHDAAYHIASGQMLDDLLRRERIPSNIVMHICWPAADVTRWHRNAMHPVIFVPAAKGEFIAPTFDGHTHRTIIVVDLTCERNADLIAKINSTYFKSPIRWIMLSDESEKIPWQDVPGLIDSQISRAIWNGPEASFYLEQFYKLQNVSVFEPFGLWKRLQQPRFKNVRSSDIVSRRRRNLQLTPISTTYVINTNDSYNHLTDFVDPHIDTVSKTSFSILAALMETLNATNVVHFADIWGQPDPVTGRFNGMIGDIISRRSLIAGSLFFVTAERMKLMDFITVINPTYMGFVFRAPPLTHVSNIYRLPFEADVWLAGASLTVAACMLVWLTVRVSKDDGVDGVDRLSVSELLVLGAGAVAQMGMSFQSNRASTRLALITFIVFLLFMFVSYTAKIVSLLQATSHNIRTLDDLHRSKLQMAVTNNTYSRWWFSTASDPLRRAIYNEKVLPGDGFISVETGIERMRQGMYAFHVEEGPGFRMIERTFFDHEKCSLSYINYMGRWRRPFVVMTKQSPFKELIRINLFRIHEHGIQSRVISKFYIPKPICAGSGSGFQPVRFIDCGFLVQFLGVGCALATVILGLEVLYRHRRAAFVGRCADAH